MLRGPDHMAMRVMWMLRREWFARLLAEKARDPEIPDRFLVLHAVKAGLRQRQLRGTAQYPALPRIEEYARRGIDHRAARIRVEFARSVDLVVARVAIVHLDDGVPARTELVLEIGRASCRERVDDWAFAVNS